MIGVTGGVASGKSEVTRRFEALGIVVADADIAARDAVAPGSAGLADIVAVFGMDALASDGTLDRVPMRRRIFNDPRAKRQLEAIVHPRVRALLQRQCEQASSPYAMAAIPLLAEGGGRTAYPWLTRILVVDVPTALQRERLLRRDGIDIDLANRMIDAQASRAQRLAIADDVIDNSGTLEQLQILVQRLHADYLALAGSVARRP